MELKELCLQLAYSDTEEEVIDLLDKYGYWDKEDSWRCYGDNENNFSIIGNQQGRPEAAIAEKIINSVDAVLMAECLKRRINPESREAPQSINDALINFFGIFEGRLSNITAQERSKLAENICLVATGSKSNPSYAVIDKGEGQTPNKMPDTLLSIGRSNKLRIPFVQGKFNQGGTGVLQFCGHQNLQLIISKRNPEIANFEEDISKHLWGFTVVRRISPSKGVRSSIYKYLAPRGEILSFESDSLPLFPNSYPIAFGEDIQWGTYIKLYEYQMTGFRTNILFDLYNRLSLLLPNVALPVRFFERRKGYSGHSFETTLSGLSVRLDEDKRENLEVNFPTSASFTALGQRMKAKIFAFKEGQSEKYAKSEGIIFTVNGQTQGTLSKSFFLRKKSVGMGYLADSILVVVDCTDFAGISREDFFMTSRDRIRSGELRTNIEKKLEDLIKRHQGLRELRLKRRREEIEDKLKDSKPLVEVIENILKKSPTLSKLFIDGVRIANPFKLESSSEQRIFEGSEFPSFFKLINSYPKTNPKKCPLNMRFRVKYQTNATNDYFDRDKDPGSFSLRINDFDIEDYTLNLWNGTANLTVQLPNDVEVGDILHFQSKVNDINRIEPFEEDFFVVAEKDASKTKGGKGGRRASSDQSRGSEVEKSAFLDLPNVIEVKKDKWERFSFDEYSALKVICSGEKEYDFFVNMDNIYLQTEIKGNQSIDERLLTARFKYGIVLLGIALLKEADSEDFKNMEDDMSNDFNIFNLIGKISKAVALMLLPMISSLGDLVLEDVSNEYK